MAMAEKSLEIPRLADFGPIANRQANPSPWHQEGRCYVACDTLLRFGLCNGARRPNSIGK
jgi:hypothetical protein